MDLLEARQNLDDAIAAYAKGDYCTVAYRLALDALVCGSPCVITTGGTSNQAAANAANFVNAGKGDFLAYCAAWGEKRDAKKVGEVVLYYLLDDLVCVNDAGAKLLRAADLHFQHLDLVRRAA